MKLAVVVQRYGAQINGGAELHARYIVELLAKQHQVDVLTTCARDYVTWRDEYPEGTEKVRGVTVRRFKVSRERDVEDFGRRSVQVFEHRHSIADEIAWLESEGPTSPALIDYVSTHANDYDYIFFFSYRYYHAYHGVRAVANKAILVPTAERDATIGLSVFGPIFRGVRAIMYNSHEERAMVQAATGNQHVPGVVVGIGSEVPRNPVASRFRRKYNLHDPFVIYVGRIDENKGCRELFTFFTSYRPRLGQRLKLVLIGNSILPIPDHPNVQHLGFVSDQDKFDAMAAADALIMPSYYESLSMVALEAWALGRPVLANGRCDVLRGQCIRSRAGLYYDSFEEFAETLFTVTSNRGLAEALGDNGRHYFDTHYAWSVIERKYSDILRQLAHEDASGKRKPSVIEPLPGWLTRRRKTLPPAADVLKDLPTGAAGSDSAAGAGVGSRSGSSAGAGVGSGASAGAGAGSSAGARGAHDGDTSLVSAGGAPVSLEPSRTGSHAPMARPEGGAGGGGVEGRRGDGREARDGREGRESREGRDGGRRDGHRGDRGGRGGERGDRGDRGERGRQGQDGRREARDGSGGRESSDGLGPRESREGGDQREVRDGQPPREGGEARAPREGREGREGRGDRDGRDRRDRHRSRGGHRDRSRDGRDGREGREARDGAREGATDAARDTSREQPRPAADGTPSGERGGNSERREGRDQERRDGERRDKEPREGGAAEGDRGPRPPRREGNGGGGRRRPRDGRSSGSRGGR